MIDRLKAAASGFAGTIGALTAAPLFLATMGAASVLQAASPAEGRVARRPQTTTPDETAAGGPFMRHTRDSRIEGFVSSGVAYSGLVNNSLKPAPGYLRYLDVYIAAAAGTTTDAAFQADGPYNVAQNIMFKDAFGQPIIQGGGYEILKLVAMYSGQHGFWDSSDPANLPSFSTVVAGTGAYAFRSRIPLELFDGFCAIAGSNATAVPQLSVNLAAGATVLSGTLTSLGTLTTKIQESYYAVPLDDPALAPPDNGSSHQWSQQTIANALSGVGQAASLALPPQGSYVTTLIFVFRDAAGVRQDLILPAGTSNVELWVDGVPVFIEDVDTRIDLMFQMFGVTRPAGVLVYSFRNAVANFGPISSLDTGDLFLPTTAGTLIELRSAAWGRSAYTGPASVTVISGRVYARGGIPYTHLAD